MATREMDIVEHRGNGEGLAANENGMDNSVDRIRDIIFGAQIQDYSAKFEQIASYLKAIETRLDQVNERISEHERDIDSQIANQKKKFEAELAQLDSDFSKQLGDLAQEAEDRADVLSTSISNLGKKTRRDMKQATQELSTLKMDRGTLGDLFVQMGQVLVEDEAAIAVKEAPKPARAKSAPSKSETSKPARAKSVSAD